MSDSFRFFSTTDVPALLDMRASLEGASKLKCEEFGTEPESCVLLEGSETVAEIEINRTGDDLFSEEVADFVEFLEDGEGDKTLVETALKAANAIIAIQVLSDDGSDSAFKQMDPVLGFLAQNFEGLLHADGAGFYKGTDLIFEMA